MNIERAARLFRAIAIRQERRQELLNGIYEAIKPLPGDINHNDFEEYFESILHQRQLVSQQGKCQFGCHTDCLRMGANGPICRFTCKPCPELQLKKTKQLVSILNGSENQ